MEIRTLHLLNLTVTFPEFERNVFSKDVTFARYFFAFQCNFILHKMSAEISGKHIGRHLVRRQRYKSRTPLNSGTSYENDP